MVIIEARNWKLPDHMFMDYAYMMYHSKKHLSGTYSPPLGFFVDMLERLLEEPIKDQAINILCYEDAKVIGWGHASYSDNGFDSEIYVYIIEEFRRRGYGYSMFQYLLERIPSTLENITVPAIDDHRFFIEKKYRSKQLSKEIRGILNIKTVVSKPHLKYLVLTNASIHKHPDILEQILTLNHQSCTVEQFLANLNRRITILGAKNIYLIHLENKQVLAYTHLVYHFEHNEQLGFVEETRFRDGFSDSLELDMKCGLIDYVKYHTNIKSLMTFNDVTSKVNKLLGFSYLNTNYTYLVNLR